MLDSNTVKLMSGLGLEISAGHWTESDGKTCLMQSLPIPDSHDQHAF